MLQHNRLKLALTVLLSIVLLMTNGCSSQFVKGNIYREGFKTGQIKSQLFNLKTGSYAILPFKGISDTKANGIATDGDAVADLLAIQMLYNGFKVLEREKMQRLLQEQAFQMSGATVPSPNSQKTNDADQVAIGKILGVDYIISGSVIQYEFKIFNSRRSALNVTVTARILDVKAGKILFAMSAGAQGDNLPEALDGITSAFTSALKEKQVYVWEQ
jgi:TolB-like protein